MQAKNNTKISDPFSPLAIIGFVIALVSGLAEILSGFGHRWGIWNYRTGFVILRWAAYAAIIAATASLFAAMLTRPGRGRRGFVLSLMGLLTAVVIAGVPGFFWQRAHQVPAIHDITTDMDNPPLFVMIIPLRKSAANKAEYGGPEIAAKQRAAYPDIVPLELSNPPHQAFEQALSAARSLGWRIIDAKEPQGRIEASDTTFWFGFTDDIVVRIAAAGRGSRIDVRSVSRVGKSDIGTNARRIRGYLKKIQQK